MTELRVLPRSVSSSARRRSLVLWLALGGATTGCASFKAPFGRVSSLVVGDRYVTSTEVANVRVVRANAVVSPTGGMRVAPGDSIATSSVTRVVMEFAAGYRVTLDTSTVLFLETGVEGGTEPGGGEAPGLFAREVVARPATRRGMAPHAAPRPPGVRAEGAAGGILAFFLRIGRAYIERVRGTPDSVAVTTPARVVLHDAGTRFLVTVAPSGTTTLGVVEGAVRVEAADAGRWRPVTYTRLGRGELVAGEPPRSLPALEPPEVEAQLRWVRDVRRLTMIPVPRLDSMTQAEARAAVERVGLRVLLVRHERTGRAAPERVVSQEPSAGDSVAPGTFVNLVLESTPRAVPADTVAGRTDTGRVTAPPCTVPDIVGVGRAEAERRLSAAKLVGRGTRDPGETDTVTSQSNRPGTLVRCGSVVRYRYGVVG
jgi:hypothetical protein